MRYEVYWMPNVCKWKSICEREYVVYIKYHLWISYPILRIYRQIKGIDASQLIWVARTTHCSTAHFWRDPLEYVALGKIAARVKRVFVELNRTPPPIHKHHKSIVNFMWQPFYLSMNVSWLSKKGLNSPNISNNVIYTRRKYESIDALQLK